MTRSVADRKRASRARAATGAPKRARCSDADYMRAYRQRLKAKKGTSQAPATPAQRKRAHRARQKALAAAAARVLRAEKAPEVLTPEMRYLLKRRWKTYHESLQFLFTMLLVACAFCGTCGFKNDVRGGVNFKRVSPTGGNESTAKSAF